MKKLRDKFRSLFNRPGEYWPIVLLLLFGAIAVTANVIGLIQIFNERDEVILALICLVALFALISLFLQTNAQRCNIRFSREAAAFSVLHEIIEELRDYRTLKQNSDEPIGKEEINRQLKKISNVFLTNYLAPRHNGKISLALKYLDGEQLNAIRVGNKAAVREAQPEKKEVCHVYGVFNRPVEKANKSNFIYVRDIDNPTRQELEVLGDSYAEIKARASRNGYRTFIALPIKTGNLRPGQTAVVKEVLGFLGLDMEFPYAFGEIPEHQRHCMSLFVDAISELVADCSPKASPA